MRVRVRVRDHTLEINVGEGSQRLKWLAVISLQRYEETIGEDSGEKAFSSAHVATGIMDAAGTLLPPNKSIRVALEDMQEVFVLVQADDDPKGARLLLLHLLLHLLLRSSSQMQEARAPQTG